MGAEIHYSGIGRRWLRFDTVSSTNAIAAAHAHEVENHGLVVTADAQTSGRGQYDRTWSTPPATAVLMSILLFPPNELRRASILTAWAAVSVCSAIRELVGAESEIKWPNDVLLGGRKVCGILCEGGSRHVVAGIGLNVNQSQLELDRLGLPAATSLAIHSNRELDLTHVAGKMVRLLSESYANLERGDLAKLEREWTTRLGLTGLSVEVERMDGSHIRGRLAQAAFTGIEIETEGCRIVLAPEAIRHVTAR